MKNIFNYYKKIKFSTNYILIFVLVLFLFLFIWFLYNKNITEGLTTDVVFNQINTILDDKSHNDFIKIKAITGIVYMMDDENDQTKFNSILNNDGLDQSQKINGVKRTMNEIKERIEEQKKNKENKDKSVNAQKQSEEASKNSPMRSLDD